MKTTKAPLVAALLFAWAAFPGFARDLQLGTVAPAQSPWGVAFDRFAQLVSDQSKGRLTIRHFPSGQLGQEQDLVRQTARGRVDIVGVSNTAMSLLTPEIALLSMPYLFDSPEQSDCVYETLGDSLLGRLEASGVVPLAWMEVGHQILLTQDRIIQAPSDFKGMRIRAAPTVSDTLFLEHAGASPVPLNIPETLQRLQTGAIGGATFPTSFAFAAGIDKIAPMITVTNHAHQVGGVLISGRVWQSLDEQDRAVLKSAAETAFASLRHDVRSSEQAGLDQAQKQGATIYVPSPAELSEWSAAAQAAYPRIVEKSGSNTQQLWVDVKTALSQCGAQNRPASN